MYTKTRNQIVFHLPDDQIRNARTNFSQLEPNTSSLNQSPIVTESRDQSDHSPEPFLYPSSLQPMHAQKWPKNLNLKDQIITLLTKLKEWLQQLSLTQSFSREIAEQLEPIIQQLTHTDDQSGFSCWSEKIQYGQERKSLNSVYLKDSHIANIESLKAADQHCRYRSVLFQEQTSQIILLNEGEKNIVKLFFKRYYRLIQNCLMRINRCTGQKKLKFLVETTMRNIFSQTLRVSYDLKIVQHKLLQKKQSKDEISKFPNINLLKNRLEILINERGGIKYAFSLFKILYFESSSRDSEVVGKMVNKISKLSSIYEKNKRSQLRQCTYLWREVVFENKISQTILLIDVVRQRIQQVLSSLVNTGECQQSFSAHWRSVVEQHMNHIIDELFPGQQCVFISLQDILKERFIKRQKHISVIDFIEEQEQASSITHRSQLCRQHPFLSDFTLQELKNCIISGEIHRSDKLANSLLLVPIKPLPGIIFASLSTNNESHSPTAFSRISMSLHSFRLLLRVVEVITPLLEDLSNLCKRVENNWEEVQKGSHYQLLFKEYLKFDMFKTNSLNFEGHLQIQNQAQSQITVNSHRLQIPNQVVRTVLDRFSINNLMIYHRQDSQSIKEQPCIVYGDQELARVQSYIINSIYRELVSSGKDLLIINRNAKTYHILPMRKEGHIIGLIHYTCQSSEKVDPYVISECLVPLILKYEGIFNCQQCTISLTLPSTENKPTIGQSQPAPLKALPFQQLAEIMSCHTLLQLQSLSLKLIKSTGNFFHKMIYRLDLADISRYYSLEDNLLVHHHIRQSQIISHQEMFIEEYSSLINCSTLAQITFSHPCFSNPQLHIYQHQNAFPFRMIGLPILSEGQMFGYFLVGHYLISEINNEKIIDYFKSLVTYISLNNQIFKAKRLDDSQLKESLLNDRQTTDLKSLAITKTLQQWSGKGKLIQQFDSIIHTLMNEQILISGKTEISLIKIDTDAKKMKLLYSFDNPTSKQSLALPEEIINIFSESNIMATHEKLQTSQCKLKKHSINRTLKPIKAQQLQTTNLFVPPINYSCQRQLIKIIKNKFQLQGWVANQNWTILNDIMIKLHLKNEDSNKMYFLVNLGLQGQKKDQFFIILGEQVLILNDEIILNQSIIEALQQTFSKMLQKCLYFQSGIFQRSQSIHKLSCILKNGHSIERSISQFYQNWVVNTSKAQLLFKKLSLVICSTKNKKYYQQIRKPFKRLKAIRQQIDGRNHIFYERLTSALEAPIKRQQKRYGFLSIQNSIKKPILFNKIRGCSKLFSIFHKAASFVLRQRWQNIGKISELHYLNKKNMKMTAACKIYHSFKLNNNRQNKQYFFNQIYKIFKQYVYSFQLINQQCQRTNFNSKETFIRFANERFMTVIAHLKFGSILAIQIMAAQVVANQLIIYKLGSSNQLLQVYTENKVNYEFEKDKGLIFLPINLQMNNKTNPHYIIYKITGKTGQAISLQKAIIHRVIQEGVVPCYSRYLQKIIQRANKMCEIMMVVSCKQVWNGSAGSAQNIYAFSGIQIENQCYKLRAMNHLKSLKQGSRISELKIVRSAINEESKMYYHLEYQCNALSNALAGGISTSTQQREILYKYGDLITRQQLKQIRESNSTLEQDEQKQLLQYQIKRKIFATTKITTFYQQKENTQLQKISRQYLRRANGSKENQHRYANESHLQKVYVDKKVELTQIKEKIRKQKNKMFKQTVRGLWIILNRVVRRQQNEKKRRTLSILFEPAVYA